MRTTVREDKQIKAFLASDSQSTRPAQCYCVNRAQTGVTRLKDLRRRRSARIGRLAIYGSRLEGNPVENHGRHPVSR
jgi:hypothetical protein